MRWPSWIAAAPSLVAEALVPVADPLPHWLRPGPVVDPAALASALSRALLPPLEDRAPPAWLRADQRLSFARALAAVRQHGGALLADSVGSGKSFIALAVALALRPEHPVTVLAPAALREQWQRVSERVGARVVLHSHELLSRGRLPPDTRGILVIDESHRFRTPSTRRYETLAPWCVGRRGLLLSATPVVNRMEDLAHQLLLLLRNDVLAWVGIPRLTELAIQRAPAALTNLVITGEDRTAALPAAVSRDLRVMEPGGGEGEALRHGLEALTLSQAPAVASLLRGTLLVELASSPAAIAEALRRYRGLLLHARDAAVCGRRYTRETIRRILGTEPDQLVLWELFDSGIASSDLALDDLAKVEGLEVMARRWAASGDAKLATLSSLLDEKPTLVFSHAIATIDQLRRRLGPQVAWCTGQESGVDALRLPREVVLDWFRQPGGNENGRPSLLLATDVASEGLDLPLIQRVVHYDLPWTAVRLEQRSGRALRLSSAAARVEVVRLLPPHELERALHREQIVARKSRLPERIGLGASPDAPWRLSARQAARWERIAPLEGVAAVEGAIAGVVAGFRIVLENGGEHHVVLARRETVWSADIGTIFRLLEEVGEGAAERGPSPAAIRRLLRSLAVQVRAALRTVQGSRLATDSPSDPRRQVIRRLLALARDAARQRNQERLALVERGLALLRRGHTAGESRMVAAWRELTSDTLLARLQDLPAAEQRAEVTKVELIGILVVEAACESR